MATAANCKKNPIFSGFSEEQIQALLRSARTEVWDPLKVIFTEGDPPEYFYIILAGKVKVSRASGSGDEVSLGILTEGDFFGEMALLDGSARSATVSTLDRSEFLVIGQDDFMQLFRQSPPLIQALFKGVGNNIRRMNGEVLFRQEQNRELASNLERERMTAIIWNHSSSVEEAIQAAIDYVCGTGWSVGHAFMVSGDASKRLFSSSIWKIKESDHLKSFCRVSNVADLAVGEDLPGMVLASGKSIWIENLANELRCPRSEVAWECGLRSGLGIPAWSGDRVIAVLEFFSETHLRPDEVLLAAAAEVGRQLGNVFERKICEQQLLYRAMHDALTGLPNRTLLLDRLSLALARAKRDATYLFAVVFLDLDCFKGINDNLGHTFGDKVLMEVGRRLQSCARAVDVVGRIGGDEFVLLLEELKDRGEVEIVMDRVRKKLAMPLRIGEAEVCASASMGVAFALPHYELPEQILRDADGAMYLAKKKGRGLFEFFQPTTA